MKALVITQDPKACRINPTTGETIEAFRPSVVTVTEFITDLVMKRLLKPVGFELPDTATDAEFERFYKDSDGDADLAIDSFLSKMDQDKRAAEDAEYAAFAAEDKPKSAAQYTVQVDNKGNASGLSLPGAEAKPETAAAPAPTPGTAAAAAAAAAGAK